MTSARLLRGPPKWQQFRCVWSRWTAGFPRLPNPCVRAARYTSPTLRIEERKQMRESPDAPAPLAPGLSDDSAGLYVDFEAAFRGTREEIRQKQSVYIPMLRDAGAGQHDRPVVDLGCGRGEWLELLRAEQMQASGVDSNESMIETCRGLGLNAAQGDAFSHLRGL